MFNDFTFITSIGFAIIFYSLVFIIVSLFILYLSISNKKHIEKLYSDYSVFAQEKTDSDYSSLELTCYTDGQIFIKNDVDEKGHEWDSITPWKKKKLSTISGYILIVSEPNKTFIHSLDRNKELLNSLEINK